MLKQVSEPKDVQGANMIYNYLLKQLYALDRPVHDDYALGVRRDHPVSERKLLIEPHLGDLAHAEGVVVTEFGPVPVSWRRENGRVNFVITIPPDIQAVLALPNSDAIQIDGASVKGTVSGTRRTFPLKTGMHRGSYPADMK